MLLIKGKACKHILLKEPVVYLMIKNSYEMKVVVSGREISMIREILRNRNYYLIECYEPTTDTHPNYIFSVFKKDFFSCAIRKRSAEGDKEGYRYFLRLNAVRCSKEDCGIRGRREMADVKYKVTYPTADEFIIFMKDKEMTFSVNYVGHEGNVEYTINRKFHDFIMLLRDKRENCIYDDFYDVRIFLQKVMDKTETIPNELQPVDIRDFSINKEILQYLRELSKGFFGDETMDYAGVYTMQSEKINAQYFLTKYHSNPSWEFNPVVVFNFRISAFMLPGYTTMNEKRNLTKSTFSQDRFGDNYRVDSIHFNSDICFDLSEFKTLMIWHYYEVDL